MKLSRPPGDMGWSLIGNVLYFLKAFKSKDPDSIPSSTVMLRGDMGWPFIGNMWSFLRAFKSKDPESFINSYVRRYGRIGIYKSFMFGNPSVLITVPELCKLVYTDNDRFKPGWPKSTAELIGKKSFVCVPRDEHKRLRKLTAGPINGQEALSTYLEYIEDAVVSTLEKTPNMGELEFLTLIRKLTFKIIMYIFVSDEGDPVMDALEKEYKTLDYGIRSMAINLPGFAYYKALKARKRLCKILQSVLTKRRGIHEKYGPPAKKDMMDNLMIVEDENGEKLDDEQIIDILLMYLMAGHESSAHLTMWIVVLLQEHPDMFQKAKVEQEEIVKNRSPMKKGLTLEEIRQMDYLSKVVDETLRYINISLMAFREATEDVILNGYLIPKGWKVQIWMRNVHLDPLVYADPKKFDPSRWDEYTPKAGAFIPFGLGSRLCPGKNLAKLEIFVFLHHFLLNYRLERLNPKCPIIYLPHTRPTDNCLARIKKISPLVY
ncbi:Cytochrome p450 [Thalictrum thalictroides]|uniref:Cytochrome p450 n=1 Tax=Thalictrum thalictroides TaxID=46969 RepID=A0A7J6WMF5_THATH|nr:Cytochrome p450 [Thalictrum thalictroides]